MRRRKKEEEEEEEEEEEDNNCCQSINYLCYLYDISCCKHL